MKTPQHKALESARSKEIRLMNSHLVSRHNRSAARKLTINESKEKTKDWPKTTHQKINPVDYQRKYGRAYND